MGTTSLSSASSGSPLRLLLRIFRALPGIKCILYCRRGSANVIHLSAISRELVHLLCSSRPCYLADLHPLHHLYTSHPLHNEHLLHSGTKTTRGGRAWLPDRMDCGR